MTRRPAIIAAAVLIVFGITASVQTADAITAKTRQCVKEARTRLKTRTVDARNEARAAFSTEFTSCFGPGAECASGCLADQASCQAEINEGVADERDNCKAEFEKDLDDCRQPGVGDPVACASDARLTQFACNQAVAASIAAPLQGCSTEFGQCTAACASAR